MNLFMALVALLLVAASSCVLVAVDAAAIVKADGYSFEMYVKEFGKQYGSTEEFDMRKDIFLARRDMVAEHNRKYDAGKSSYKRAINHLSDRTEDELKQIKGLDSLLHFQTHRQSSATIAERKRNLADAKTLAGLPASVDWREKGIISPVKNQGECGSCWTFASVETIESHWALKVGYLVELSEQFILDCTPNPHECGGTGGCMGGTGELAYARLKELGGIPSEWTYPYVSILGKASTCHGTFPLPPASPHTGKVSAAANVTGFHNTVSNSYADMLHTLATVGPLAVSVDASQWHDYAGGVFDGGNHTNPSLDHLVQLVGYGTDEETGKDYWLIRNSWTPMWGENGYIRLLKEADASCGMDLSPGDGDGCKGGPPQVKVCGQNGVLYDGVYPEV